MSNYSIIIPVYNSEKSISILVAELLDLFENLAVEFEIVLINDCSRDGSWNIISGLAKSSKFVSAINLVRNYGQHNALLCGILASKYERIVTLDDDLQHPPREIKKLIEKYEQGYDVVYGTPEKRKHGSFRNILTLIIRVALGSLIDSEIAKNVSAFRIINRKVTETFVEYGNSYILIDVLLAWNTTCFASVPVSHDSRECGRSNYSLGKLLAFTFNMISGFSAFPLRLASYVGFLFSAIGFLSLGYILLNYFYYGRVVQGFVFLASIISIFSGIQFFCLGIFGEYLAKIYNKSVGKPAFRIRERIN